MRVAIVGSTGFTGQETVRLAMRHPQLDVVALVSEHEKGRDTAPYFLSIPGVPKTFVSVEELNLISDVDLIFLCQSAKDGAHWIEGWVNRGIRVVDLSADFRFSDVTRYEQYYGTHPAPKLLPLAFSGFADDPEMIYPESKWILGNPGCYPTAFFTAMGPLARKGFKFSSILVDGKSGVTGAGRRPQTHLLLAEMSENVEAYSRPGIHRHTAEMEMVVDSPVTFQPHYVPIARGIELTIYLPKLGQDVWVIKDIWSSFYEGSSFVTVLSEGLPRTARVRNTNHVELQADADERTGTVVLTAAIDNLGKGAAGQAIQHVNQWYGWNPSWGLI